MRARTSWETTTTTLPGQFISLCRNAWARPVSARDRADSCHRGGGEMDDVYFEPGIQYSIFNPTRLQQGFLPRRVSACVCECHRMKTSAGRQSGGSESFHAWDTMNDQAVADSISTS
jgi:hypothetical protein